MPITNFVPRLEWDYHVQAPLETMGSSWNSGEFQGYPGNPWWFSCVDNPYTPPGGTSGYNIYESGVLGEGYGVPNCTAYAYGRYAEARGEWANLPMGNAGQWWGDVDSSFQKGSTPALGAVVCYDEYGSAGHVAIVEQINQDGSIVTSNSGYKRPRPYSSQNPWYFWTATVYPSDNYLETGWMSPSDWGFQGFIYNDGAGPGPGPGPTPGTRKGMPLWMMLRRLP